MIKNLSAITIIAAVLSMTSCGGRNEQDKPKAEQEVVPIVQVQKGATERHARVGMNTTKIAEERRIAITKIAEVAPFYKSEEGTLIYYRSETIPTYTGGDTAIALFIEENLQYPPSMKGQEGTIFVDFIINANGSIRNVKATDSTFAGDDEAFRKEALRLVNLMPRWIPGRQQGKVVDVQYSVPITFLIA